MSRSNQGYFIVCFGSVVALFVAVGMLTTRFADEPTQLQATLAALGISVMGLVAEMASLWKQKVSADLLIVLCSAADETHLQKIIDELLKRM